MTFAMFHSTSLAVLVIVGPFSRKKNTAVVNLTNSGRLGQLLRDPHRVLGSTTNHIHDTTLLHTGNDETDHGVQTIYLIPLFCGGNTR